MKKRIAIAFPTSILDDAPDLRSKTLKLGQIARACAIFQVETIFLIEDENVRDIPLIKTILEYVECPQYLRKLLFPISESLKYVGLLSPLATPHHQLKRSGDQLHRGDIREGAVLSSNDQESVIEVGIERPIKVNQPNLRRGSRVSVEIIEIGKQLEAKIISRQSISSYWGYHIKHYTLKDLLETQKDSLIIGTSRKGESFAKEKDAILAKLDLKISVLLLFGSIKNDIQSLFTREGISRKETTDFMINLVRKQGTRTIRTEEAILFGLFFVHSLMITP